MNVIKCPSNKNIKLLLQRHHILNLVVERLNSKTYLMGKAHPSSHARCYMPNTMLL